MTTDDCPKAPPSSHPASLPPCPRVQACISFADEDRVGACISFADEDRVGHTLTSAGDDKGMHALRGR